MNNNYIYFLKEFTKSFNQTGSIIPSSVALAKVMVRSLEESTKALRILEVGAGTGSVTKQILKMMKPVDNLTICEINPKFVEILKDNLIKSDYFLKNQQRISIVQAPVQDFGSDIRKFDLIISSLPFANFGPELVQDILDCYKRMLMDDGQVVFFQYIGLKKIVRLFASEGTKRRVAEVEKVLDSWCNSKEVKLEKELALLNIPPACTYRVNYL